MRFIVYGAGAIGGILGARLHQAGRSVVLVARGPHFELIRNRGLRLAGVDGEIAVVSIPVVDRISGVRFREGDVVFLAMKSQDTEAALRELAVTAPVEVAVACLQNGVENERLALRRFANVYGIVVMCPSAYLEPGVVMVHASPISGILDIGRYPCGSDPISRTIAVNLREATYLSDTREDIMSWKFAKLLRNVDNALIALAGPDAAGTAIGKSMRAEAEAVLRLAGIGVTPSAEFEARNDQLRPHLSGSPSNSSWQSLVRGSSSIETDYLNGEIVLVARRHGVAAPLNDAVQRMARELVLAGGEPGSVPIQRVVEHLAENERRALLVAEDHHPSANAYGAALRPDST